MKNKDYGDKSIATVILKNSLVLNMIVVANEPLRFDDKSNFYT